jgi:polygalacturonase
MRFEPPGVGCCSFHSSILSPPFSILVGSAAALCALLFSGPQAVYAAPFLPIIPAYTTNIAQAPYNARPDGATDNTTAIQSAINDVNARGGGTVQIPGPGVYLSGPLNLKNKINLQLDAGATLRMLPYGIWPGTAPLLTASSLSNIELSGSGGIDGQGAAWWANKPGSGLYMIYFNNCNTVLVQNVTVSNAPAQQVVFKGKAGNITLQGVTIRAASSHVSPPSHNTDGIDLVGTNCLVQNCDISTGDDNIAIGSSGGVSAGILVTNCTFGVGHGMTIGSHTEGGVSNLTVINCSFNGTDYGIRMKSDNDRGGLAQNLGYYNLGMTNLRYAPVAIHSYYNSDNDPIGVTPATAASQAIAAATSTTPIWRNILISNVVATVASGGQAGILWGRTELPVTNVTLAKINITAPANFDLYNAYGLQFVDAQITLPGSSKTFSLYNAQVGITNGALATNVFSFDGLAATNALALYNARAAMSDAGALSANPITLCASTLSNSTSLTLPTTTVLNFALGTNTTALAVSGNLALSSTLNIADGGGFGAGRYTLFTYTGSLSGSPTLGATPSGYLCNLDTSTARQVNLIVTSTSSPPTITNQPASQAVLAGSNVLFTVGASGSVPLSYQWWFNSTNCLLAGTNASLTISKAQPTDTGAYCVVVTNTAGRATSSVATLQVFATPAATLDSPAFIPPDQFSFTISGVPGFSYVVQQSTNLQDWLPLATNTSPFSLLDTNPALFPTRFYRAVYLP